MGRFRSIGGRATEQSAMAKSRRTLRSVDYFRKVPRDLTEGSLSGGSISIIATCVMILLVFGEVRDYMSKKTVTDVYADTTTNGNLRINFDVYFREVSCEHLSVDVMDVIGNLKSNVTATIKKLAKKTTDEWVQNDGSMRATGKSRTSWLTKGYFSGNTLNQQHPDPEGREFSRTLQETRHAPHNYHNEHVLKDGEESEFVENWEKAHPDLVEWYEGMSVFKDLVPRDQVRDVSLRLLLCARFSLDS